MSTPDSISSSDDFEAYTTLAALEAAFASGNRKGQVARRIISMTTGILRLRPARSAASTIDWVVESGVPEDIQVNGFTASGSTVSPSASFPIKVYF